MSATRRSCETTRRALLRSAIAVSTLIAASGRTFGQEQRGYIAVFHVSVPISEQTETGHELWAEFFKELRRLGWIEGENLTVARYSAERRQDRVEEIMGAIVASQPDVIFAPGTPYGIAAQAATRAIPIVFMMADPVAAGLAESLARPGGNATGVTTSPGPEIEGKRLQLLLDAVPTARRIAYLVSRGHWEGVWQDVMPSAAKELGVELIPIIVEGELDEDEQRQVLASIAAQNVDALQRANAGILRPIDPALYEFALNRKLPTIATGARQVGLGALMGYGRSPSWSAFEKAAGYIDRILTGEKPAEMPVERPAAADFDLIINLRTARALGIEIPPKLLIQATELIE